MHRLGSTPLFVESDDRRLPGEYQGGFFDVGPYVREPDGTVVYQYRDGTRQTNGKERTLDGGGSDS